MIKVTVSIIIPNIAKIPVSYMLKAEDYTIKIVAEHSRDWSGWSSLHNGFLVRMYHSLPEVWNPNRTKKVDEEE